MSDNQRRPAGAANGNAKLTAEQVAKIRATHKPGQGGNTAELAAAFGISKRYVTLLARGAWRTTE